MRQRYAPRLYLERINVQFLSSYFHSTVDSDTDLDKSHLPIADTSNLKKRVSIEELRLASKQYL